MKGSDEGFFKLKTRHFCHLNNRVQPEYQEKKNAMSRRDKLKHAFHITRCFHGQPTLERETARNKWCLAHTHFAIFGKLVLLQVYNAQADNHRLKKMNLK